MHVYICVLIYVYVYILSQTTCTENKRRNRQIKAYDRSQPTAITPESQVCVVGGGRLGRDVYGGGGAVPPKTDTLSFKLEGRWVGLVRWVWWGFGGFFGGFTEARVAPRIQPQCFCSGPAPSSSPLPPCGGRRSPSPGSRPGWRSGSPSAAERPVTVWPPRCSFCAEPSTDHPAEQSTTVRASAPKGVKRSEDTQLKTLNKHFQCLFSYSFPLTISSQDVFLLRYVRFKVSVCLMLHDSFGFMKKPMKPQLPQEDYFKN